MQYIDLNTPSIKAIEYENLNKYYQKEYFKFKDKKGNVAIATTESCSLLFAGYRKFIISKENLIKILERDFSVENTSWAINHLKNKAPKASAKNVSYKKSITGFIVIFTLALCLCTNMLNILSNTIYLAQNFLKAILFKRSLVVETQSPIANLSPNLPIYSILIPLYKEEYKVEEILIAMSKLNYPKAKLDIKILIEDNDPMTKKAIMGYKIPDYIQILKVPFSLPQTKPKALNYAMPYVIGKYLVIYDAEDIPDRNQLLKAVYAFRQLPKNYACVQAKLNFYNKDYNLLTRLFSIEYSLWFQYLLRGLSLFDLPITLGGSSNHFKTNILKKVGCWDPYNVTEDADLGLRLYMKGYKTYIINSTTAEEAPSSIFIWIAQRSRWIKGFIQTLLVFIKAKKDYKKMNLVKIASVYFFIGLTTYSLFCLPWLLITVKLENNSLYFFSIINIIFSISYMYSIAYVILKKNNQSIRNFTIKDWFAITIWPFYFILHTIACYLALLEIMQSPFKWNKTPHGLVNQEVILNKQELNLNKERIKKKQNKIK